MFYKKRDNRLNKLILQGALLLCCTFFLALALALSIDRESRNKSSKANNIRVVKGVCAKAPSVFTFSVVSKDRPFCWQQKSRSFYYKKRTYGVVKSEMMGGRLVLKCVDNGNTCVVSKGLGPSSQSLSFNECPTGECMVNQRNSVCDTVFVFIITPETHSIPAVAS
ncbi:MAG TPA: hypothetical protein VD905_17335 [Flavobacteriales bacterium]|nr:hypothetical protein [Flavobacteriales bacterium]